MSACPRIEIRALTKTYRRENGDLVRPVDNIDMVVDDNEIVVLLGPSGCGKTTLLRCVAGLERPDSGEILINGQVVFSSRDKIFLPPEKRRISMIFQSYALWPHMTVFDNVSYPLKALGIAKREIGTRVQAILDVAGVGGLGGQYPGRISGGQQQRVALARALVSDSSVVLFDEPLSNVDTQVRARLRFELRKLQQEIGFSALYVTHDQSEALELGHQVAVLDSGRVADVGAPQRVYAAPANEYVANFVGVANLFPLTITSHQEGSLRADSELGPLQIDIDAGSSWKTGDAAIAVVRPEDVSIRRLEPQLPVNGFQGRIEALLFGGAHTELVVSSKRA